jgi:pimeloyl-ACP methyl ester carboxylesterase
MLRDLIPQLSDRFRLVAPDLPAFGHSDMLARGTVGVFFDPASR